MVAVSIIRASSSNTNTNTKTSLHTNNRSIVILLFLKVLTFWSFPSIAVAFCVVVQPPHHQRYFYYQQQQQQQQQNQNQISKQVTRQYFTNTFIRKHNNNINNNICKLSASFDSFENESNCETKSISNSQTTTMSSTSSSSTSSFLPLNWIPLNPSTFPTCKVNNRQFAKDDDYLRAIHQVWESHYNEQTDIPVETAPFVYYSRSSSSISSDTPSVPLYGHLIRRRQDQQRQASSTDQAEEQQEKTTTSTTTSTIPNNNNKKKKLIPAILFFHTGAGPHDIFLFYKAYQLLQEELNDDNENVVIMITDLLSDDIGWGWDSDRTKYNQVYTSLLENGSELLQLRSIAPIQALCDLSSTTTTNNNNNNDINIDPHKIATIGWCLGGKPTLSLGLLLPLTTASTSSTSTTTESSTSTTESSSALLPLPSFTITAMSTFHGVFSEDEQINIFKSPENNNNNDNDKNTTTTNNNNNINQQTEICIFNGMDDPFVSSINVEIAKQRLEISGHIVVQIFQLPNAKHGFSNPAQDYNPNPAFQYNHEAATKSWKETIALLHRNL